MLCTIVLSYILVTSDGSTSKKTKYLDKYLFDNYVKLFLQNKEAWPPEIKDITDVSVETLTPFDCYSGPHGKSF